MPLAISARATEANLLYRLNTNKRRVRDAAPLSSSWCYYGVWSASTNKENYWIGVLNLTVKREYKDGRVVIGKTYTYQQFPLTVWSLMKAALGRDGTGAGSVYWRAYIRGWRAGKEVVAGWWSEQVLVRGR